MTLVFFDAVFAAGEMDWRRGVVAGDMGVA